MEDGPDIATATGILGFLVCYRLVRLFCLVVMRFILFMGDFLYGWSVVIVF